MSHEATTDNPYTRGIAEFVSGLKYDAIPAEVRHRIKLLMLDALGCALYGADLEWCRILQDALSRLDTTRECGVWGTKKKLSAPHAALANGTAVQGFELDDVHRAGVLQFTHTLVGELPTCQPRFAHLAWKAASRSICLLARVSTPATTHGSSQSSTSMPIDSRERTS